MPFFLYGGLEPIWSRVVLDFASILMLGGCISTEPSDLHTVILLVPLTLTFLTAGLTNRWTLSFPMIPLALLQALRRLTFFAESWSAAGVLVAILSAMLLFLTITLCIAFPAARLPAVQGKYKVGIVDLYLPVDLSTLSSGSATAGPPAPGHVIARILYPTDDSGTMSYLKKETEDEYLKQSILTAAPPPISNMHWFLNNWKLITLESKRNARVLDDGKFPIVAFSHGLGGSAAVYSYQTRSLAANGYVVIAIDHTDGSSPAVMKQDGSVMTLDYGPKVLWDKGDHTESVNARRTQTEWRAKELAAAAVAVQQLNVKNIPELEDLGISFVNRLETSAVTAMGHSFGGSTALTFGVRRPDLVKAIIAHEPATDWIPNDVRRKIFPNSAMANYEPEYNGGTGGFGDALDDNAITFYNNMPVLILNSQQWWDLDGMGMCKLFHHMHKYGSLGPYGDCSIVKEAYHSEFSDTCALTPLWLARALKVTGKRNPNDTAEEMVTRSLAFLEASKVGGHETDTDGNQPQSCSKE